MQLKIRTNIADILFLLTMILTLAFPYASYFKAICIILFFVYLLLLMLISKKMVINKLQLLWLFAFLLLCYLSKYWARESQGISDLITNVLWAVLLNGACAIYVCLYKLGVMQIAKRMMIVSLFLLFNIVINGSFNEGRFSVGINENQFGFIVAGLGCFLFYYANKRNWKDWFANIMVLFLSILALVSGSRSSVLVLGIYIILFLMFEYPPKNISKLVTKVICIFLLAWIAFFCVMRIEFLYTSIGNRIETLFDFLSGESQQDGSAVTRSNMMILAMDIFRKNPLLGIGMNNFKYATYYRTYAHSNYFELAACLGVVGLLIYYLPAFMFLRRSYSQWKNRIPESVVPMALILTFFVRDIGTVSYFANSSHVFLGLAIGMTYICGEKV